MMFFVVLAEGRLYPVKQKQEPLLSVSTGWGDNISDIFVHMITQGVTVDAKKCTMRCSVPTYTFVLQRLVK